MTYTEKEMNEMYKEHMKSEKKFEIYGKKKNGTLQYLFPVRAISINGAKIIANVEIKELSKKYPNAMKEFDRFKIVENKSKPIKVKVNSVRTKRKVKKNFINRETRNIDGNTYIMIKDSSDLKMVDKYALKNMKVSYNEYKIFRKKHNMPIKSFNEWIIGFWLRIEKNEKK